MKQWEIIREAQENGKKIRNTKWRKTDNFVMWGGVNWIDNQGRITFPVLSADDWELYVEPIKTFGPDRAMYWLERGKWLRQTIWEPRDLFIKRGDSGNIVFGPDKYKRGKPNLYWFPTKWHLCDSEGNYVPEPEVEG